MSRLEFMCDTLTNTCGADQTAKDTCANAKTAASAASTGTGAQADAFNAAFGFTTVRLLVISWYHCHDLISRIDFYQHSGG